MFLVGGQLPVLDDVGTRLLSLCGSPVRQTLASRVCKSCKQRVKARYLSPTSAQSGCTSLLLTTHRGTCPKAPPHGRRGCKMQSAG